MNEVEIGNYLRLLWWELFKYFFLFEKWYNLFYFRIIVVIVQLKFWNFSNKDNLLIILKGVMGKFFN